MIKRVLTLVLSAGMTAVALYAMLGPRDYSKYHSRHHHHHHDCEQVVDDPDS